MFDWIRNLTSRPSSGRDDGTEDIALLDRPRLPVLSRPLMSGDLVRHQDPVSSGDGGTKAVSENQTRPVEPISSGIDYVWVNTSEFKHTFSLSPRTNSHPSTTGRHVMVRKTDDGVMEYGIPRRIYASPSVWLPIESFKARGISVSRLEDAATEHGWDISRDDDGAITSVLVPKGTDLRSLMNRRPRTPADHAQAAGDLPGNTRFVTSAALAEELHLSESLLYQRMLRLGLTRRRIKQPHPGRGRNTIWEYAVTPEQVDLLRRMPSSWPDSVLRPSGFINIDAATVTMRRAKVPATIEASAAVQISGFNKIVSRICRRFPGQETVIKQAITEVVPAARHYHAYKSLLRQIPKEMRREADTRIRGAASEINRIARETSSQG